MIVDALLSGVAIGLKVGVAIFVTLLVVAIAAWILEKFN